MTEGLARAVAWIAGTGPVTAEHVALAPRLRIVARYGVGTDAVDRVALARRDITLTNTPGANAAAVADHTIGLTLAALRGTVAGDRSVRGGAPIPPPGRELGSCTVGLIGLGAVGRAVQCRLAGFGSRIVAHDPFFTTPPEGVALLELDELASAADVVSLHRPGAQRPIVDEQFIGRLPRGAVVINTSRAGLIDQSALAAALVSGCVAAAGLDVHAVEPGAGSPLVDAPNVVLTPHVSGHTVDAIDRMGEMTASQVLSMIEGRTPEHVVPAPASEAGR